MKRLGLRATNLSTDKNAESETKPSQTTEHQLFYIVCWALAISHNLILNLDTYLGNR
jgi:hypothetical protein